MSKQEKAVAAISTFVEDAITEVAAGKINVKRWSDDTMVNADVDYEFEFRGLHFDVRERGAVISIGGISVEVDVWTSTLHQRLYDACSKRADTQGAEERVRSRERASQKEAAARQLKYAELAAKLPK